MSEIFDKIHERIDTWITWNLKKSWELNIDFEGFWTYFQWITEFFESFGL